MRRIALVADLHGNLPATMALDADLKRRNLTEIWCLGDIVGKGPNSADTFDWAVKNCSVILRGNWDEGITKRHFSRNDQFYYDQLGEERMQKLGELPLEHHFTLSGKRIRLLHGRPIMKELQSTRDTSDNLRWLFEPNFDVVGYADVHRPGYRSLYFPGLLFNTGSVGNALGVPMVQYAILQGEDGDAPAPLDITFVSVPYDNEQAIRDAENTPGFPGLACYIKEIRHGEYGRKLPSTKPNIEF
ncbi:MAG: metallophosphoesterase family protein [Clostridia bacterium]|nr:metallophosphoesterase family protein [Clostridia bacterium]